MKNAVILLSGGIDSATTLAVAMARGDNAYAISFDYGQRHNIELDCARTIAEQFRVTKHLVVNVNLRDIGGSALTADIGVPKISAKDRKRGRSKEEEETASHKNSQSIPVTYVPARNTIFLSFALAWAETLGAADIFIGANAIDYSGYPDCRPEFIRAFEDMANLATKVSVEGKVKFRIQAPLIHLTKADIIRKGVELGVDYSRSWSCYDPQPGNNEPAAHHLPFIPCMKCDSCLIRAKGFQEAGIKDPLYEN
jgi:7-cyano-7-deazaguanine synthase